MMDHPIDVDLLIFDVDGTLRECTVVGHPCLHLPGEWRLKPKVQKVMQNYPLRYWHPEAPQGTVELALVSNQAGVALGDLTCDMAEQLLWETLEEVLREPWPHPGSSLHSLCQTGSITGICLGLSVRLCATHPDQADMRRIPNPGMLWEAMIEHGVLPDRTLMVGDRPDDALAVERANVPFMWAKTFF